MGPSSTKSAFMNSTATSARELCVIVIRTVLDQDRSPAVDVERGRLSAVLTCSGFRSFLASDPTAADVDLISSAALPILDVDCRDHCEALGATTPQMLLVDLCARAGDRAFRTHDCGDRVAAFTHHAPGSAQ